MSGSQVLFRKLKLFSLHVPGTRRQHPCGQASAAEVVRVPLPVGLGSRPAPDPKANPVLILQFALSLPGGTTPLTSALLGVSPLVFIFSSALFVTSFGV